MAAPFHTSSDGIFLYHQRLSAYKWLRHGFSLRRDQDGVEMSYSLNEFQPRETVLKNRQRLVRSVSGQELPLAILRQVHSDRIFKASRFRRLTVCLSCLSILISELSRRCMRGGAAPF